MGTATIHLRLLPCFNSLAGEQTSATVLKPEKASPVSGAPGYSREADEQPNVGDIHCSITKPLGQQKCRLKCPQEIEQEREDHWLRAQSEKS
ncbi:hypothetical protein CK203_081489 [Vitis vinifera]|uniref:Uncharacterized protein n=1 Tax=Vitis vinifera TaxID=29760 RepID=A0A438DYE9_VITVI|nr:hypothetical protein CK203_081489 [Vitis vinifera]